MTLKKVLACLGIVIVSSLAAVTGGLAQSQPDWLKGDLKKPLKELKIGFSSLGVGINGYSAIFYDTMKKRSAELGIQLIILDGGTDPAQQAQQIPTLITQKVDVAVIWPINSEAIVPSIKQLKAAGIPVVNANSKVGPAAWDDIAAFTGPNDVEEAYNAGKLMVEALNGKGNVLLITGPPGYDVSQLRIDGFKKAIAEAPGIKLLDAQPADWSAEKAQTVTENWITRFGKDIDGIESSDGGTATGVVAAVNAAVAEGKLDAGHIKFSDPSIFGPIYDLVVSGDYYGGVIQPPYQDANLAFETAVKVAEGIPVPKENLFKAPVVTRANIKEHERPNW